MKKLFLMRGVTGSGKSTRAEEIKNDWMFRDWSVVVCSADNFFMKDGQYKFNPAALGHAHCWCQLCALKAMVDETNVVIIDNTNTQAWEMKPYVQWGLKLGYEIKIVEPYTSWAFDAEELAKKTQHGVPIEGIRRMLDRWEKNVTVEQILAAGDR